MRRVRIPLFAIAASLAAGCGATAPEQAERKPAATSVASRLVSPLAEYPGFGHDPERDDTLLAREETARENFVARCMRAKGFQYVPEPAVEVDDSMSRDELWNQPDPNGDYVASLSPAEVRAYSYALAGVADLYDEAGGPTGGCYAEADEAVPSLAATYAPVHEAYEVLEARIPRDARVRAATRRWSACMRERGFAYATPRALVAAGDTATADEALLHAAFAAGGACEAAAGLAAATEAARYDIEVELVKRYRDVLESYPRRAEP